VLLGGSLKLFSGLETLIVLFEELFGILDFKDQDSPETLQQSLLQDELIAKVLQTFVEQVDHCLLRVLKMLIEGFPKVVFLDFELELEKTFQFLIG
jgi:hypothetical protein